jgi:hypothetical protein
MNARAAKFAQRRLTLQVECALQREALALASAQLGQGLAFVNRGLNAVRGARVVPILLSALSAAGLASRAGGLLRLLSRAMFIITMVQRLKRSFR